MKELKKLFRGDHPFITQPGLWLVAGHGMFGDPLERVPVQGRVQISHLDGKILNDGEMSLVSRTAEGSSFHTSYEMSPTEDELVLSFFQANESVGDLRGKVVGFDDRLISTYTSGDGALTGFEVLHKMGDNRYAVTGTLLDRGQVVNLWKLDLVRPSAEGSNP
ncbi:MAG: hypothetical protein JSV00_05885 [bacterium]|nr:MAG: hypothetical protein JSV00_05885 [bacterium]